MMPRPVPIPTASTRATRNVARTYAMSEWNPALPASRTRSWTFSGKIFVTNCQMLRPPSRKKMTVKSTRNAPVTISVTVAAVDNAPLVSLA